jgi:uncharacterized lipoprotein
MQAKMVILAGAVAVLVLSACGSAPKRPYGSDTTHQKTLAEQCQDAQVNNTVPPVACPQSTTTRSRRTLPDINTDGIGFPGPLSIPAQPLPRVIR